jgi:translocation and assembly module TamB
MTLDLDKPTEVGPPKRRTRMTLRVLGVCLLLVFAVVIAGIIYVNTDSFKRHMTAKTIEAIEKATGGRTELKELEWSFTHRTVVLTDLTVHGREDSTEIPLIHIARLTAKIRIISLVGRDFALERVEVQQPTIHVIVYPDGSTNQPQPVLRPMAAGAPLAQMFRIDLEHAQANDGLLILNEKKIPIALTADNVKAQLAYQHNEKRFEGKFASSNVEVRSPAIKTFAGGADSTFTLYSDHAQIQSLLLTTKHSTMNASGDVGSFQPFRTQAKYQGEIDMAEFASVVSMPELRGGRVAVNGILIYDQGEANVSGKVLIHDGQYVDPNIRLRTVNGGSDFTYSSRTDRLSLPHIFLHGLGGNAIGSLQIDSLVGQEAKRNPQHGVGTFDVTAVSGRELAIATSSRLLPLDKLHPVAQLSGKVKLDWSGSPHKTFAVVDVVAVAPPHIASGELPVSGFLKGSLSIASGIISIASSSVDTPASHVVATGDLGSRTGNLRLTASTSNLGEVSPLIEAIRGPGPLPFDLGGKASFRGTLAGKLRSPTISGHLEAENFTTHLAQRLEAPLPQPTNTETSTYPRFVHWDSLTADFVYAPDKVTVTQAQLRRMNAVVEVNGFSALTDGLLTSDSRFQAHVLVRGADLAELQSTIGVTYPVTGRLDLTFDVNGTRNDLNGGGKLSLLNGTVYGQSFKSLNSGITFSQDQVRFGDAQLRSDLGSINGTVAYNLNSKNFSLELHGHDFRLERSSLANRPNFRATGQITFDVSGSGTIEAPVINANASLAKFILNGQPIGDIHIDAVTRGAELQLTARSSMQHAAVVLDGSIHMRGDLPGHAVLTINSNNLNPLISAFVPIRISGPTVFESRIEINGPFRDPRKLSVAVTVNRLSSELEGIGVYNAGPLTLRVADQKLIIDRFRLAGEGNRFLQVRGTAELAGEQRLDMQADGDVNLKLLQSANPNLVANGFSDFGVALNGTLTKPLINGQLNFHDGALAFLDLPNGLSAINGTVYFNQDRAQIQKLTARTGGGVLDLGGFVSYDRGVAFNVTANGREIRIRYPDGISSTATAALTLSGNLKNSVLSGDVTITRFGLNPQFDFAYYLARSKEPPGTSNTGSPLNNVRIDVHVVSTPELQVQTTLAKVSGNVDLHVRGTATHPVVLGHINIVEGKVDFNGSTYTLERGDITFANPVTIDPILDIEASAHVRDYDITLGFHGSPLQNKLSTTYRSDPPLPPGDIIALLALGRTREEATNASTAPGAQQQTFSDTTSNALLGEAINATISNRVQKIFGVSRIKIDPQVAGVENSGYARLTVDQQISNKITLTYITNLSQSAQQIIQFEYNVNRNVSILAVRDQNGIVSFDVRLRQRKR